MPTKQRPAVIEGHAQGPPRQGTTFDLYFVNYPQDGDWGGVMQALERSPWRTRMFGDRDHVLWGRMVARVEPLLPGSEIRAISGLYEMTHPSSGIQFSFVPGAIVLTVPYLYAGPDAERLVDLLRRMATGLEAETGLIAYDPQAEAPFLAYGASVAAGTFQQSCRPGVVSGDTPAAKLPKPKGWRRLCRRR